MKRANAAARIIVLIALNILMSMNIFAQTYDQLWKQVTEATQKSLPKSAARAADDIYRKAMREHNAGQAMSAWMTRSQAQSMITPDSVLSDIRDMEQWLAAEPDATNRALLSSLLAGIYSDYADSHRYEIEGRTELADGARPTDIREWTTEMLLQRADTLLMQSVSDPQLLLQASAKDYGPLAKTQKDGQHYRHSLLQVLATRAISIYSGMDSDDGIPTSQRINDIYQKAISTYSAQADMPEAVILSTVDYLRWQHETEGREAGYADIDKLISQYKTNTVCVEAYDLKSKWLERDDRLAETLAVCDDGIRLYAKNPRVAELKNCRSRILRQEASASIGGFVYPGRTATLNVSFRNVSSLTVSVYSTTLKQVPDNDDLTAKRVAAIGTLLTQETFSLSYADERTRYNLNDTVLQLKVPDKTGVFIVGLTYADGSRGSYTYLRVTRLKVLSLPLRDGRTEMTAVDAATGQPVEGVRLTFYDNRRDAAITTLTTAADGKAVLPVQTGRRWYLTFDAAKGDDTALTRQGVATGNRAYEPDDSEQTRLTLLTDRSIYRPGQTIYIKGVAYVQKDDAAAVAVGRHYSIRLLDTNGKEVSTQEAVTGDFGSFSLEMTLPQSVLNGMFRICDAEGSASTSIRVEEYKRPSFEITFDPISQAYRLGDTLHLTGQVTAYSGASVQDMPLSYTASTQEQWWFWRSRGSKGMAADTVMLDKTGRFDIPVLLKADDNDDDSMSYTVEVRVTDEAGETQTATKDFTAARQAYRINAGLPTYIDKDTDTAFTPRVTNWADTQIDATLHYTLYRLQKPGDDNGITIAEEGVLEANTKHDFSSWKQLPSAAYKMVIGVAGEESLDKGSRSESTADFILYNKSDRSLGSFVSVFCDAPSGLQFGTDGTAEFRFGTSYQDAYVMMDVFSNTARTESRVLRLSDSIETLTFGYKPEYGDGITVLFSFVKDGQLLTRQVSISKPVPDMKLDMQWQVFRDRMRPGQQEEWRLVLKNPDGTPALAELLATMYDASLDAIWQRQQSLAVGISRYVASVMIAATRQYGGSMNIHTPWRNLNVPQLLFDYLDVPSFMGYATTRFYSRPMLMRSAAMPMAKTEALMADSAAEESFDTATADLADAKQSNALREIGAAETASDNGGMAGQTDIAPIDPSALRSDFAETAFFYPTLRTDSTGAVAISFRVPESLTRWNFAAYAHTKDMKTGMLNAEAVTQKDFMLRPHLPRFLRADDEIRLTAVVNNLTDSGISGKVRFELFDPATDKVIDRQTADFNVQPQGNASVGFSIKVGERYSLVGVRMIADGGSFSDGEQRLLPVLTNKQYITETVAMPIRGNQSRTFSLDSLFNRHSPSATQRRLTVEFTGNPAWYAVLALPSISEPQHDDAIEWASAFYANVLASRIAASQPRIKQMVSLWRLQGGGKETFLSQLEKNADLKETLLSETPWVLEATSEAEQRQRIGLLFDMNLMADRIGNSLSKLQALQNADGGWSWFSGMQSGYYTTTYITGLLLRLKMLTAAMPSAANDSIESVAQHDAETDAMARKAFGYLHQQMQQHYDDIRRWYHNTADYRLGFMDMQYLYLVAIGSETVPQHYRTAYNFFFNKVKDNLQATDVITKAQSAVILKRAGQERAALQFIASLKEFMVDEDEMGAHFAFLDVPYTWCMIPVPQHVAAMEALREFSGNDSLIEEMKLWLLKQKQTRGWNSSLCTADAVYALLCTGSNLLANRGDVTLKMGNEVIETTESGRGEHDIQGLNYVRRTYQEGSKTVDARSVSVEKHDDGIAWGAVYAQYLSPMADVRQQGAEMNIDRKLFVERTSADGKKTLEPVNGDTELHVGDVVVSRLTLSLDRAIDFVQLKDRPASCFEPVAQISGYRWSNGTGYYLEVEDASTNFFFDSLGKGMHVLEVRYTASHQGTCQLGVTTVQSAYAPEFSSHTAGATITVK